MQTHETNNTVLHSYNSFQKFTGTWKFRILIYKINTKQKWYSKITFCN